MIPLSSRPLLLEIVKLSSTWAISGKGSFLLLKYSYCPCNEHKQMFTGLTQGEGHVPSPGGYTGCLPF